MQTNKQQEIEKNTKAILI